MILVMLIISCEHKKKKPDDTLTLNRNDFFVIYQNGYLKGKMSAISEINGGADKWITDSLLINNVFNRLQSLETK